MQRRLPAALAVVVFLGAAAASVATGPPYTYVKVSTDGPEVTLAPGASFETHRLRICGGKPYVAVRDLLNWTKDYEDSSVQVTVAFDPELVPSSTSRVAVSVVGLADRDTVRTIGPQSSRTQLSHKLKLQWAGGDSWCDEVEVTFAQDPTVPVNQALVWSAKADVFMTVEEPRVAYMDVIE
jgi:hypothetical protein